jgi:O-antigen/teichoic acid export membrane protein
VIFNKGRDVNWKELIISKGKWYIFSSLCTKGLSILLLPVYTRYLSPKDYGVISILNSFGQFLPILISLYIDSAFGRYYHEDKMDFTRLRSLYSTTFWFIAFYGGLVVLISLTTSYLWVKRVEVIPFSYLFLTFVPVLLSQLGQLGTIFLRQSLDARRSTLVEVSSSILSVLVIIYLLIFFKMGVIGRLIGGSIAPIICVIYYVWYFWRNKLLTFEFSFPILRRGLIYSIPLLPSLIGSWITGLSDRFILAKYNTLDSVGVYSLALSIATVLYVLQDALTQVTGPISMSGLLCDRDRTLLKISRLSEVLWATMLYFDFILIEFSDDMLALIATKDYSGAGALIGICSFAYVLSSQYRLFISILSYRGKMWVVTAASLISATVSIILNIMFTPEYGYYATSWSFVISTATAVGWIIFWAKHYERINLDWSKYGLISFVFFISCFLSNLNTSISVFTIVFKFLLALILLVAMIVIIRPTKLEIS